MTKTVDLPALAPQHKKFADEYLATNNISEAARRAGYKGSTAPQSGSRVLKRSDVAQYIAAKTAELTQPTEELSSRVIRELETMAFANIADFITIDADGRPQVDFSSATPEQLRAITSVKAKTSKRYDGKGAHIATDSESAFTLADKYRGLELLGKHLGLFKADEQRVVVDVADRLLEARRRVMLANSGALVQSGDASESLSD